MTPQPFTILTQNPQGTPNAPLVPPDSGPVTPPPEGGTTAPGTPGGGGGAAPPLGCGTDSMVMILLMVGVFYFLLIRPQQKQEKQRRAMLGALKTGDEVVTSGGLHGIVSIITENTVKITVDGDTKLTFDRSAIARTIRSEGEPEKTE